MYVQIYPKYFFYIWEVFVFSFFSSRGWHFTANLYRGGLWAHIRLVCCEMHQLWSNLRIRSLWKAKPFPAGAALHKDIKTWCETLMRRQAGRQVAAYRESPFRTMNHLGRVLLIFLFKPTARSLQNVLLNSSSALNVVPTNLPAQSTMTLNALVTANSIHVSTRAKAWRTEFEHLYTMCTSATAHHQLFNLWIQRCCRQHDCQREESVWELRSSINTYWVSSTLRNAQNLNSALKKLFMETP